MAELSDFQKKTAAETIAHNLKLDEKLANLSSILDDLFKDAPPAVVAATSKEEMDALIRGIKEGTATNDKIARFLELADKFGLA